VSHNSADRRIHELLAVPPEQYDLGWLQKALGVAVELELSTLPPYLCGYWSCKDSSSSAAQLILSVVYQEMLHMGLAANMLTSIGGTPAINTTVPTYPGPLPGGVWSGLTVYLSGLTKDYVGEVYMCIEYPEEGPITPPPPQGEVTIGQFYDTISAAFTQVDPPFTGQNQMTATIGPSPPNTVFPITSLADARNAIGEIKEQGEGTATSPDAVDFGDPLAHYYRFGEIYNGALLVPSGETWTYAGDAVPFPETYPMGRVPQGGWPDPPSNVANLLQTFDQTFKSVLDCLQAAWETDSSKALNDAINDMFNLSGPAIQLMQIPQDGGPTTYGPDFVYPSS
jgi:hypothetical protein